MYIQRLTLADMLGSQSVIDAIRREVYVIKSLYIYQDPYTADTLVRYDLEGNDTTLCREDF